MADPATNALYQAYTNDTSISLRQISDKSNIPRTTLQHRARGRRSLQEKAQSQQYLRPAEEKALVRFLLQQDALGQPVRIKYLRSIAFNLARQRSAADPPTKPPGKNWSQAFYKRHLGSLRAGKSSAMDWNRFDIYAKVVQWFDVIAAVLDGPGILQENVYNMDETGVMLSKLNTVKVLMDRTNHHSCRGARVKRTTVTAVECVSADGRYLHPMIIWPASTHRANWVTHPTPGWHYAYSDSGYTDSYLSLQWLRLVFDPQTRGRAGQRPRVLICDGFGTHETLEILEFCFQNQIILCRLPSHTSHKLQPCDVSIFSPLKAAYRDQVERLERGGVGTIGKEHFVMLYSIARKVAFTPRNIRAGWSKAGLFPFNADRVLRDLPQRDASPPALLSVGQDQQTSAQQESTLSMIPGTPLTPVTPVTTEGIAIVSDLIQRDMEDLNRDRRHRLLRHVQKLSNAARVSFAERALLQSRNDFLHKMNNEAKVRRSTRSHVVGTARVMSFEDLQKARAERAAKDAKKEAVSKRRKRSRIALDLRVNRSVDVP